MASRSRGVPRVDTAPDSQDSAAMRRASAEGTRSSGTLLVAGIAAVILLGVWGLLAPRGDGHAGHPHLGDVVAFDGGSFTVEDVVDVDLSAPMTGPGMVMGASSGVPDIPEGFRWVSVDLNVRAADDASVEIDPTEFFVTGIGVGRADPIAVDEGGTFVPAGASMGRAFTYQVPDDTAELEFWAPGADDPVMLELGDAPAPHGH
jgi:hypothetical protein